MKPNGNARAKPTAMVAINETSCGITQLTSRTTEPAPGTAPSRPGMGADMARRPPSKRLAGLVHRADLAMRVREMASVSAPPSLAKGCQAKVDDRPNWQCEQEN